MENIKIIDFCNYFGNKELLNIRINFLYDKIDKFLISEIVDEEKNNCLVEDDFNDPLNKIEILRINSFPLEELDKDKIQRDCLLSIIHQYNDEDIFIVSDCHEIIDSRIVEYYFRNIIENPKKILRIPMVLLANNINFRLCDEYQNSIIWNCPFMCNKTIFDKFTPTTIRNSILNKTKETDSFNIFIIDNGINKDAGWNFKFVGKNVDKYKVIPYYDHIPFINVFTEN